MEQEQLDRAAIANEVWDAAAEPSAPVTTPEVAEVVEVVEPVVEADPWAGVAPALREEFEGMRTRLQGLGEMDSRLKQTERRLGSVQNELHAAKEAAKAVASAPSKEQMAEAAASQGDWDALKEDFPEWTKATEGRLAAERAEILKGMPDVQQIRAEIQAEADLKLESVKTELGKSIVLMKHPDMEVVAETPDFKQWHEAKGSPNSYNPMDVIAIFDEYKSHVAARKSTSEIKAERQERLEASQTTPGRRVAPAKPDADMSPSELRAAIAKQTWNN